MPADKMACRPGSNFSGALEPPAAAALVLAGTALAVAALGAPSSEEALPAEAEAGAFPPAPAVVDLVVVVVVGSTPAAPFLLGGRTSAANHLQS